MTSSISASSASSVVALDRRIVAQRREQLPLALEFLQDVGLEVRARGDVGDLEQREQRGVMVGGRLCGREEQRARVQILQAHQRADALVQRMFVTDHDRRPTLEDATFCPNCDAGQAALPSRDMRMRGARASSR